MFDLKGLKICFLAGTLGQGGAERQLFYNLKTLKAEGAEPIVLSLTKGEFWQGRIEALDIPVIFVGGSDWRLRRILKILSVLRTEKPEILQSQHFYANGYVAIASRLMGIPVIGAIRNNGWSEARANRPIVKKLGLYGPHRLAVNSRSAMRVVQKLGVSTSRVHFLPNVVDCRHFTLKPSPCNGIFRLLAVGRLHEQKRFDRFLNVLRRLSCQSQVPVKGIIVGNGPLETPLKRKAEALGLLPDGVKFLSAVQDPLPHYHEADALILTSDWEGTPNVVLEAMACSLPVVATRVGGVPEILEHDKTGYLIDPTDEDGAVEAVSRLIHDGQLRSRIGRSAQDYVRKHHSLESLPKVLKELYEKTLACSN